MAEAIEEKVERETREKGSGYMRQNIYVNC
jgi:hypothetical protein